jgi:antitoxin HicB
MAAQRGRDARRERDALGVWPVELSPDGDGLLVYLPDIDAYTQGRDRGDALAQAADLVEEFVFAAMAHNEPVPPPSDAAGRPCVALPALTALKLEVYRAMREAGLKKGDLAARLGWPASSVSRLFDGRHASRLDQIEAALAALGRRLVIASRAA